MVERDLLAKEDFGLSERKIKLAIIEHAETMAKSLTKGKDLEVRKSQNGVSIA